MNLTKRERQVLNFIAANQVLICRATLEEIARAVGLKSKSHVSGIVNELQEKGCILKDNGKNGLRLNCDYDPLQELAQVKSELKQCKEMVRGLRLFTQRITQ